MNFKVLLVPLGWDEAAGAGAAGRAAKEGQTAGISFFFFFFL